MGAVSEEGLRLLSELYVEEVALCEAWGDSRPEEGSEHYLAYCVEDISSREAAAEAAKVAAQHLWARARAGVRARARARTVQAGPGVLRGVRVG